MRTPCSSPRALVRTAALFLALIAAAHAGNLNILTTTGDLAAIAREVAGDHAKVTAIADGRQDPHFLQAKPSFIMRARRADLWIRVGMDLEIGWEGPIIDGSRNRRIRIGQPGHLDASLDIHPLHKPTGPVTRAMGDVHPHGNPHYWLDPGNARHIAAAIARRLARLDPNNLDAYRANLDAFQNKVDRHMFGPDLPAAIAPDTLWTLHHDAKLEAELARRGLSEKLGGWARTMSGLRGRPIVTYHKSWDYFTHRFGLRILAELEPKPGIPPTAAHLATVAAVIRKNQVPVILQEPYYPPKAARRLATDTGATVVVCANSVGGTQEATGYCELIDLIVGKLAAAMEQRNP